MNEDRSPVRPMTPPGDVGSEAASSQSHWAEAFGVSEILERAEPAARSRVPPSGNEPHIVLFESTQAACRAAFRLSQPASIG